MARLVSRDADRSLLVDPKSQISVTLHRRAPEATEAPTVVRVWRLGSIILEATHNHLLQVCFVRFPQTGLLQQGQQQLARHEDGRGANVRQAGSRIRNWSGVSGSDDSEECRTGASWPFVCVVYWSATHECAGTMPTSGWLCATYDLRTMQHVTLALGCIVPEVVVPLAGGLLLRGRPSSDALSVAACGSTAPVDPTLMVPEQQLWIDGSLCVPVIDTWWMASPFVAKPVHVPLTANEVRALHVSLISEFLVCPRTRKLVDASSLASGIYDTGTDSAEGCPCPPRHCVVVSGTDKPRLALVSVEPAIDVLLWRWMSAPPPPADDLPTGGGTGGACALCVNTATPSGSSHNDSDTEAQIIALVHTGETDAAGSHDGTLWAVAMPPLLIGPLGDIEPPRPYGSPSELPGPHVLHFDAEAGQPFVLDPFQAAGEDVPVFGVLRCGPPTCSIAVVSARALIDATEASGSLTRCTLRDVEVMRLAVPGLEQGNDEDAVSCVLHSWRRGALLGLGSGARAIHIAFDDVATRCELTRLTLPVLEAVLPHAFHHIALRLLGRLWAGGPKTARRPEWSVVVEVLFELSGLGCSIAESSDAEEEEEVGEGRRGGGSGGACGVLLSSALSNPLTMSLRCVHLTRDADGGDATLAAANHEVVSADVEDAPPHPEPLLSRCDIGLLLVGLHLLLESLKLRYDQWQLLRPLGRALRILAAHLGWVRYIAYYDALFCFPDRNARATAKREAAGAPNLFSASVPAEVLQLHFEDSSSLGHGAPPDINASLRLCVQGSAPQATSWPTLRRLRRHPHPHPAGAGEHPMVIAAALHRLFRRAFADCDSGSHAALRDGTEEDGALEWWERLVEGMHQDAVLAREATSLIQDMVCGGALSPLTHALRIAKEHPRDQWSEAVLAAVGRFDRAGIMSINSGNDVIRVAAERATGRLYAKMLGGDDGVSVDSALMRQWPDSRLEAVQVMLSTATPVQLNTRSESADVVQPALIAVTRRTLSLPFGRGMVTLATQNFRVRDILPVPPLSIDGRTADGLTITNVVHQQFPEALVWPRFHNGVAAGLRFLPLPGVSAVNRYWISHQTREMQNQPERAGVLFAVGLLGHLQSIQITDIYSLLVAQSSAQDISREPTFVAVLLGLCCSFRGTCSDHIMRSLSVHLQALTPSAEDLDVVLDVQSCTLVALGLLFEGSCSSFHVELLMGEISRRPSDEYCTGREGHALAAGFGLGLILLGKGRDHGQRDVEDRLLHFMSGERREVVRPRVDGLTEFNELVVDDGHFLTRALLSRTCDPPEIPCNKVAEGSSYNTAVTGPASVVALGLIFLRTNDALMSAKLGPENALRSLQSTTPMMVLLRVLFASTTMWDSIDATATWLRKAVPSELLKLATRTDRDADPELPINRFLLMCLGHAIAGAVMAIGLRFVGSMNADARDVVLAELRGFLDGTIGTTKAPISPLQQSTGAFKACINTCVIALGLIMTGTGDTACAGVMRKLYKRTTVKFGEHMALSMGLGLLFLGAGRLTLSNSTPSIALLIIAFYPVWPHDSVEHKYHHQCFRHLYALTVVPRRMEAVDVQTNQPVSVAARVVMRSGRVESTGVAMGADRLWTPMPVGRQETAVTMTTPTLLPDPEAIERVEVRSSEYYPLTIFNDGQLGDRGLVISVLARSGSTVEDITRVEMLPEEASVVRVLRLLHQGTLPPEHAMNVLDALSLLLTLHSCRMSDGAATAVKDGALFTPDFVGNVRRALEAIYHPLFSTGTHGTGARHPMRAILIGRVSPRRVAEAIAGKPKTDGVCVDTPSIGGPAAFPNNSVRGIAMRLLQALRFVGLSDSTMLPAALRAHMENLQSRRKRIVALPQLQQLLRLDGAIIEDIVNCCVDYVSPA